MLHQHQTGSNWGSLAYLWHSEVLWCWATLRPGPQLLGVLIVHLETLKSGRSRAWWKVVLCYQGGILLSMLVLVQFCYHLCSQDPGGTVGGESYETEGKSKHLARINIWSSVIFWLFCSHNRRQLLLSGTGWEDCPSTYSGCGQDLGRSA